MPTIEELAARHPQAEAERARRLLPPERDANKMPTEDVDIEQAAERNPTEPAPTRRRPDYYAALGTALGALVDIKQIAYGDSFGRSGTVLRELYPHGIKPDQYDDMLSLVRIIDKLFRIANQRDAFGESPYRDIAGYGLLGAGRVESNARGHCAARTTNPTAEDEQREPPHAR